MKYYFAPMEGITGYIYRNVHHRFFPGMDKYFSPFISPGTKKTMTPKELRDILPENNQDYTLIPQILTNRSGDFLRLCRDLKEYGYKEVNLNLGCPSGTVVAKKKGAGFLEYPNELDRFLEEIFAGTDLKISIKTRIGKDDPEEFEKLLEIYNKYPLEELIIHPRVQTDYYKNSLIWRTLKWLWKDLKLLFAIMEICLQQIFTSSFVRDSLRWNGLCWEEGS